MTATDVLAQRLSRIVGHTVELAGGKQWRGGALCPVVLIAMPELECIADLIDCEVEPSRCAVEAAE